MDYKLIDQQLDELNLDGYKHIKNNEWNMPKQLTNWLKEHNFEMLGSGSFSEVFQSETENFVVKVNKGRIDRGYLEFVNFCQQNKGNPHLPKMGKIKKYDDWYIIFIEKLEEPETIYGEDKDDIAGYIENIATGNSEDISNYSKELQDQIIQCSSILKKYFGNDPYKHMIDIHGENIMMRGNTIVIIDPVI